MLTQADRQLLAVTCFGHFLSHFNMLAFPAIVLPLSASLDMELGAVLGLSFWQYLLFGLTALPWGAAADRWSAKKLMVLYFLGAGLCGLAAAHFMDDPLLLAASLGGIGLFSGIYHPAGLGLISKNVTRVSLAMGYNGMFGNLGLASAPLLIGLVNWRFGPAGAYVFLGALNLAGMVLMMTMRVDEGRGSSQQKAAPHQGTPANFINLLIAMMLGGLTYRGATVIIPTYLELRGEGVYQALSGFLPSGVSPNVVATGIVSLIFLIGVFGQFMGGRTGEHYEVRKSFVAFHALSLPAVFAMGFLADWPLAVASVIYFFFLLGMQPLENTLVSRLSPPHWRHSAFGAKFILTFGVGALAVKMDAYVEQRFGVEVIFPILGGITILLIITALILIKRTRPIRTEG